MSTLSIQPVVLFLHVGVKVLPFGTSLDVLPGEKSNHTSTSLIIQGWVFDGFSFTSFMMSASRILHLWTWLSLCLISFMPNEASQYFTVIHPSPVLNSAVTLSFSALGSEIVSKPAKSLRVAMLGDAGMLGC